VPQKRGVPQTDGVETASRAMPAPSIIEGRPMIPNFTDSAMGPHRSLQDGSIRPSSDNHPSPSYVR
jgi:hypothetical protein